MIVGYVLAMFLDKVPSSIHSHFLIQNIGLPKASLLVFGHETHILLQWMMSMLAYGPPNSADVLISSWCVPLLMCQPPSLIFLISTVWYFHSHLFSQ